jgi:hypothetical protein
MAFALQLLGPTPSRQAGCSAAPRGTDDRIRSELREYGIDFSGITLFVAALKDARANGWQLEIDTNAGHRIVRVLEITGVDAVFWPENRLRPATMAPRPQTGTITHSCSATGSE